MTFPISSSPPVEQWLRELYERWQLHGDRLCELMVQHIAGRDCFNEHAADKELLRLEADGWIQRSGSRAHPTTSQGAFAGYAYTRRGYDEYSRGMASHWYWTPPLPRLTRCS